jgi:hypothetical protein
MTDKKEKRPNVLKEWADRMTALLLGRRPAEKTEEDKLREKAREISEQK